MFNAVASLITVEIHVSSQFIHSHSNFSISKLSVNGLLIVTFERRDVALHEAEISSLINVNCVCANS